MSSLLQWRKEFPILESTCYMISNSLGAMPRKTYDDLRQYADTWARRGVRAWEEAWWMIPAEVGDLMAPLIGAGSGEVIMQTNVTLTQAQILSCFEFKPPRDKIVCEAMNFPSVMYLYQQATRRGARFETVPSHDGIHTPTEAMLQAIDEETLLVPMSHVIFKSAYVQDVQKIIDHAHQVGALVILDVYQSAGILPIDVKALNVDVVIGGCLKWLCGGPGNAFLYVRPDLYEKLEPALTGWLSHESPFDFEPPPIRRRHDVWRFLSGTPPIPAHYAARAGLEIVNRIGVSAIRENSVRQTARLIALADEAGLTVNSPRDPDQRGGTVSVDLPGAMEVARELVRRDFLVDYRPGAGIRLSPHFYNTDDEIDAVVGEIKKVSNSQAVSSVRR
ncbi:MAG: aminotransferase class V-fold PLP-dependent enzyme [Acidobacteriia bacterium]|nr:aminotransferase class V-fold PLP-dependent enzyme [Terriglobia bacterium]